LLLVLFGREGGGSRRGERHGEHTRGKQGLRTWRNQFVRRHLAGQSRLATDRA
jgi:hypothetical protein